MASFETDIEKNSTENLRIWHRIWRKQNEIMDPSCLVTTVQAGGVGVMVRGIFSWHTLGLLVPIGKSLFDHHVPNIVWLLPAG